MSSFTVTEIEFLSSQHLGRLATVGADTMPHVIPVGVFYDHEVEALVIGSNAEFGESAMSASKKFRDAQSQPNVALVVDDGSPRFIEVRGHAEAHLEGGAEVGKRLGAPFQFGPAWLRIRPTRIVSLGVNGTQFGLSARNVT